MWNTNWYLQGGSPQVEYVTIPIRDSVKVSVDTMPPVKSSSENVSIKAVSTSPSIPVISDSVSININNNSQKNISVKKC